MGYFYLYILLVAYYLRYTSTLSTYLGTFRGPSLLGNSYRTFKAYRDY